MGSTWTAHMLKDAVKETAKNAAMSVPPLRAARLKRPRAGSRFEGSMDQLERYAFQSVRSVLDVEGSVRGASILELGPGDGLTSGLSFLFAGAASYTAVDRFPYDYSSPEAKRWYEGIQAGWRKAFPNLHPPHDLDWTDFPEAYGDRVDIIAKAVEDVTISRRFDVICSYQVAEHVRDPAKFARLNAALLAPTGVAVHRVDFGPHDCWTTYADALTFLRFADWAWFLMGSNRGYPNRVRQQQFADALRAAGLRLEIRDLEAIPQVAVDPTRWARRFQTLPPDDVRVKTATFVGRR